MGKTDVGRWGAAAPVTKFPGARIGLGVIAAALPVVVGAVTLYTGRLAVLVDVGTTFRVDKVGCTDE